MSKSRLAVITGVIVPIIIFLITPFWSSIFTDGKTLTYQVLEKKKVSELAADDFVGSRIQLSYDGKDIRQGTFIVVAVENSGKAPIQKRDFNSDIFIDIKGGSVLFAQVVDTQPVNIPVEISGRADKVAISPLLMNSGDKITVKIFSDSDIRIDSVYARILGVPEILKVENPESSGLLLTTVRPLDGGGVMEKKIMSVYIKILVPLTLVLLLGVFVCTAAAALSRGVTRIVFGLLVLALYASSLTGYSIITEYMQHNIGIGKWESFLICLAALLVMGYLSMRIRHVMVRDLELRRVHRTHRIY